MSLSPDEFEYERLQRPPGGDTTYGVGITDDGGIALAREDGTIVDQVGLSAG
jgi:hypothetical protein